MRIPSLGLVTGDIIALMAGDVTPGKVHELLPEEMVHNNSLSQSIHNSNRRRGSEGSVNYKCSLLNVETENLKSKEEKLLEREILLRLEGRERGRCSIGQSWSMREKSPSLSNDDPHSLVHANLNLSSSSTLNPIQSIQSIRSDRNRNNYGKILEKGTKIHLRVRYPDKDKNTARNKDNRVSRNSLREINSNNSSACDVNGSGKTAKEPGTYESTYKSKLNTSGKVR